jgi:hypothetical protein
LTFTGDYTQGARPNGQRFCIGADCPQPILIPDGTAYGVIVASGLGDPNKQCFPADKYDSETANLAIDAILSLDIGWGRDPNKMWCMTNQCSSNQSQSPMSSTDFLEYKDSTDPTQRKGLFAQQRNAFLYYFSCSAQGCAADFQKLSLDLTYQAHAW